MFGILSGDLLDGKLGRRDDRTHALVVALPFRPSDPELAGTLVRREFDAGVLLEPEPGGLKNRGNGRTNQIVRVDGEFGVAGGKN